MENAINIGDNIRKVRKAHGLSQIELAERVGVAPITIRQYENGKRSPKLETIAKLAQALDVSIVDLFPDALDSDEAWQFLSQQPQQLGEAVQQCLYEALNDLRIELEEKADKTKAEGGEQPSFQTLSAWASSLVQPIAKAHSLPPQLLRKYMWPTINDLAPHSEEDALFQRVLDLLQGMTPDGRKAALHHLEELAQIPAYQAKSAPQNGPEELKPE